MANVHLGAALRHVHKLFAEGTLAGLADARLLERYASDRDEPAFEALVRRHGPMVMAVCRGVLDDPNDADDAFQAAFLLLARKARSLWVSDSLGGWLHRVACRIALQLKADGARRRDQERRAAQMAGARARSTAAWDDVNTVIHQEIDRLPERYRQPIVLCYLEEMTYEQAAGHLRWSEGTTRGRLARGRDLLRDRLTRRGVTLADVGPCGLAVPKASSALSTALFETTVRAARHFVLGEAAAAGTVSTASATLVKQALRTMMMTKLKMAGAAALLVGVFTCVATSLAGVGPALPGEANGTLPSIDDGRSALEKRPVPAHSDEPAKAADNGESPIIFQGRVFGPDGRAAGRAGVYTFLPRGAGTNEPKLMAKTDSDGRFRFSLPKTELDAALGLGPFAEFTLLASSEGLGPDWLSWRKPPDAELALKLVDDSVPIAGRILDLEGRPVAGAKITRGRIMAEGADGIDPYLKDVREDPMRASNHHFAKNYWIALPGAPASTLTDGDGRFRLTGIGRARIVDLAVEGPTIQSATITAMTRAAASVSAPPGAFAAKTIYGATFDHTIPPGRALTGVVRDKRTKKPLAGVTVCGKNTNARVTTDAQGRYTLPGFPKSQSYGLMVLAEEKVPYFVTCQNVPDTAGLAPIEADVECVPGIPMRLKLTDNETGKSVTGADVFYEPIYPNPHSREVPGYAPVRGIGPYNSGIWQPDGTCLLGVLPGPGGVFVRTAEGLYGPACVDPKAFFKANEMKDPKGRQQNLYGDLNSIYTAHGDGWSGTPQSQFSAIVLVNPTEDSGPLTAEFALERDPKREVHAIGPDGKPLTDVTVEGDGANVSSSGLLTVFKLNPLRPKRFVFRANSQKLVGCLIARGDEREPYTVKLEPWATISGRLVTKEGKPRPRVILMTSDWQEAMTNPVRGVIPYGQKTDADGRFRYEGLGPGQEYTANAVGAQAAKGGFGIVIDRVVLEPGETRDLGDVQSRVPKPENPP